MSITVDQSWVYQFHDVLHLTYQREGSALEKLIDPAMVHRGVRAAIDHHERLGNVIANDQVNPFGQAQILNPAHTRRAATLQSSDATVLISDENTLRAMVNPTSGYTRTIVYALGRRADKHVLDNAVGSATTASVTSGSGVITYGTQALPSSQLTGDSNAMSLAKVIAAAQTLSKGAVPNGPKERIFIYAPGQLQDILAITQASSSDFTRNMIHDRGTIDGVDWEGFHWVEMPDVIDPSGTVLQRMLALSGSTRNCIAMHKGAVGLSIGKEISTVLDPRPDLQSRPMQVRSAMMMIAVRVWDLGVVQVQAKEN